MNRLDSINFLKDLDEEALVFIDDRLQEVTVPIGGHVVKAGDHAYRFFVIFEGTAIVSQDGQVMATLGAGDVFGEMALLEDLRRNADVVAATDMRLGVLRSWDFREAARTYSSFQNRIDDLGVKRSVG